jgi:hypothetical protein
MKGLGVRALVLAKAISQSADSINKPLDEVQRPASEPVLAFSLVKNTRPYLEKVVHQINASYNQTCYDACLVMARRLLETLIIEAFEHRNIDHRIKDPSSGNFFTLSRLVQAALAESWNIGRKARGALPKLKELGDRSAHDRRFNAHRHHVDKVADDLAVVVQEFISLAGLK